MREKSLFWFASLVVALAGAASGQGDGPSFSRQIRPLLSRNCFACHGPDEGHRSGDLRLDERADAVRERDGYRVVVPGDPDASDLFARITDEDAHFRMPPTETGKSLSSDEIELVRRWIEAGARYEQHWAFVKPGRPEAPTVEKVEWPRSELDRFVLARLHAAGLEPAPEADRHALIRRLALDLTGLPPTPDEVKAFVADRRPDAYERLVDRLLASPAHGERWARVWLDLARYADSSGYGSDPLRTIWRYRDWVIQALNSNMPFDRFTVEQLAGDLLPDATVEQRLATAFHRNTMTNTEGGTDDEEFRVAAVRDRAETTMQVWMGVTLRCARCHTHKFDPIPHVDYYRFYAFFNQTEDTDRNDDAPRLATPTEEDRRRRAELEVELSALEAALAAPDDAVDRAQRSWEAAPGSGWRTLDFARTSTASGARLQRLEDGSLLATGAAADTDVYELVSERVPGHLRGLRLELLPHESLPSGGLSRAKENGNVVLNDLELGVHSRDAGPVRARRVRLELRGADRILSLAEVQVFEDGENIAAEGRPSQSSTAHGGPARLAIDGETGGDYHAAMSVTHTATEDDPWWELDFGAERAIERLVIWNRTDGDLQGRLDGCVVTLRGDDDVVVRAAELRSAPRREVSIDLSDGTMLVPLVEPSASFAQQGWDVARAIDADPGAGSGWGLAPNWREAQEAVFSAAYPISMPEGSRLTLKLTQSHGSGHVIGRFRVSVTSAPPPHRAMPADVRSIIAVPRVSRDAAARDRLAAYYRTIDPSLATLRRDVARKQEELDGLPVVTTPVMVELPPERRRRSYLHRAGNFMEKGEEVEAGVFGAFHPMPRGAPANRLGVARWLLDDDNPLTARVTVNRYWARLFGVGLVETEEDFGSQGSLPSHPGLLDWLAVEFRESGWDMKALLKTIVSSATYRQASITTAAKREKDPRNRLLSRGPRFRLDAETLRDQALAMSGLLSRKMYGPSVHPPQPDGLWQAAFNGQREWPTSEGEDRYRRGIYTFLRRTVPYPSMASFDLPSREICAVRRIRTNTPMQAFVTLNDPAWMEMTRALAKRIVEQGGPTTTARLRFGLALALSRPADDAEVARLVELYESERAHYATRPDEAAELAAMTPGGAPDGIADAGFAAWIVVANVLLNLDAVLMKG